METGSSSLRSAKPFMNDVCKPEEAVRAAMEGYFVPDEENEHVEEKDDGEATVLFGDNDKLSASQTQTMLMLKESMVYSRFKLKQISLSFSGASVFFFSPIRKDGTPMPSSVLKFDIHENVNDEVGKTAKYAPLFGLTTPKVKDVKYLVGSDPQDPSAVMQIDLCGGIFGLPEFASAPPVLTFASVIETELRSKERRVDVVPVVNEALERRMHGFTMSERSVQKVNMAAMYKIVRFVGHGVLNRAAEGAKRGKKTAALAAGFMNPPQIDDLDREGCFLREVAGIRKTVKDFFNGFVAHEKAFNSKFSREVVLGLCHNDLHGGNLLLDSQGLVWLIDFATVKSDMHVLMDLSKFMASCLFLYLEGNTSEQHVRSFAKLLFTTPDATTALPVVGGAELKRDVVASFVIELLSRLRHCMCIYEIGDDAPSNDGVPFILAMFSWSARMLSYSEPSLQQKSRALYYALVGSQRVLLEAGVDVGPVAMEWINQFRLVWEGQKGRRLSTSATQLQVAAFQFQVEFPRYLAQVGTSEAWSTDFLTREKVHVTDHCIAVSVALGSKVTPRHMVISQQSVALLKKLRRVNEQYVPQVYKIEYFYGRLLITGDSGSGKTMLTRQIFSETCQQQLLDLYGAQDAGAAIAAGVGAQITQNNVSLMPVRLPLIDLARQLEAEPDTSLEADPVNDLLTQWIQRKYGQDSVPEKLVSDIRNTCLAITHRHSLNMGMHNAGSPQDNADQVSGTAGSGRRNSGSSQDRAAPLPGSESAEISGLLMLFDGLDETSSCKGPVLEYMKSFISSEPTHLTVLTSRPNTITIADCDFFRALSFYSFGMSSLMPPQAADITKRTLERMKDPQELIVAVQEQVADDGYASLSKNPLILTLLIHVLRKSYQLRLAEIAVEPGKTLDADTLKKQDILNKTEVYQRAVRLMLHQSDAAKFALREGKNDQAMVRRLEMLKSVRARKLFQQIAWYAHCEKARLMGWDSLKKASSDTEMLQVFEEAFKQGRMPIFEKVEGAGSSEMLQMTHLSFQELMTGEYTSAIVRHSHANQNVRAYMNFFLSNSTKSLDRGRLSELWWVQVWMHICEMLHPAAFEDWCEILSEDERAHLRDGQLTKRHSLNGQASDARSNPWHLKELFVDKFQASNLDFEAHTATLKLIKKRSCSKNFRDWMSGLHHVSEMPFPFVDIQWCLDGIALIFRQAAQSRSVTFSAVIKRLLDNGVHYALVDDDYGKSPVVEAFCQKSWSNLELMTKNGASETSKLNTFLGCEYSGMRNGSKEFVKLFGMSTALHHLRRRTTWAYGVLEQAQAGTLDVTADVDFNFSDLTSGMTPLMLAASAGQAEIVRGLLLRRAQVDAETTEGATALTFAVECGCTSKGSDECLELLIAARADLSQRAGKTYAVGKWCFEEFGRGDPLGNAVCNLHDKGKLEILLKAGYDPLVPNDYGVDPLWCACVAQEPQLAQRLIDAKADVFHLLSRHHGCTHRPGMWNWHVFGHPYWLPEKYHKKALSKFDVFVNTVMHGMSSDFVFRLFELGLTHECGMYLSLPFTPLLFWPSYIMFFYWSPDVNANGDTRGLRAFIDRGLDLNKMTSIGYSIMHFHAMVRNEKVLHFLFENADISQKCVLGVDFEGVMKWTGNDFGIEVLADWRMTRAESSESAKK